MKEKAIDYANEAFNLQPQYNSFRGVAYHIKAAFDKMFGAGWSCIVSQTEECGCYYDSEHYIELEYAVEQTKVRLFRSKVSCFAFCFPNFRSKFSK